MVGSVPGPAKVTPVKPVKVHVGEDPSEGNATNSLFKLSEKYSVPSVAVATWEILLRLVDAGKLQTDEPSAFEKALTRPGALDNPNTSPLATVGGATRLVVAPNAVEVQLF